MKPFKLAVSLCALVALSSLFAPQLSADDWNRKTIIKFSGPVEIPAVHLAGWGVLPAGTYVFKILDSQSNRHIVQIFSEDEKTVYATILAIPNYRLRSTDKTVMTFRERPAGQPEALRAWFYPGRNWGEEFVYPKSKAIELAKATNTPVLFTPAELPVEVAEPVKLADAATELKRAPIMAVKPTGEEVQLAEVVTPPPAEETRVAAAPEPAASPAAAPASAPAAELPATASPLPTIGIAGLLTLAAAFLLRGIRTHRS